MGISIKLTTDLLELVSKILKQQTERVIKTLNKFCEHSKELVPFLYELHKLTNHRFLKDRVARILYNLSQQTPESPDS